MAMISLREPPRIARPVAIKALGRLAERWHLTRRQVARLLARPDRTVRDWFERTRSNPLDRDILERISHLIAIYDGLHKLFGDSEYADRWIHEQNVAFGGRTPLELLESGSFTLLTEVRRYIDRALSL